MKTDGLQAVTNSNSRTDGERRAMGCRFSDFHTVSGHVGQLFAMPMGDGYRHSGNAKQVTGRTSSAGVVGTRPSHMRSSQA